MVHHADRQLSTRFINEDESPKHLFTLRLLWKKCCSYWVTRLFDISSIFDVIIVIPLPFTDRMAFVPRAIVKGSSLFSVEI